MTGGGFPAKAEVVGTPISMTHYDEVLDLVDKRPDDSATVISVCNVHSVMVARKDPALAAALAASEIATPDGVPLVWTLRRTARPDQQRVYGPELMRRALQQGTDRGWRHYFYGSTDETLEKLMAAVATMAPGASIVGSEAPPFRRLTAEEQATALARIRDAGTDVLWVGLGMPKQELWMHEIRAELPGVAVVGVGAAFDFLAGVKAQAPPWMQRAGLEWLFRLGTEPRRLWRRYLWNNPAFLLLMGKQLVMHRVGKRRSVSG